MTASLLVTKNIAKSGVKGCSLIENIEIQFQMIVLNNN